MKTSESTDKLLPALVAFQAEVEPAEKGSRNTFFKGPDGKGHRYASIEEILATLRVPLKKNDLMFTQSAEAVEGNVLIMTTRVSHTSGQWLEATLPVAIGKPDPQGYGGTVTYARRYALQAALGLSAEDDDAEGAMGRGSAGQAPKKPPAKNPPVKKPGTSAPTAYGRAKALAEKSRKDMPTLLDYVLRLSNPKNLEKGEADKLIDIIDGWIVEDKTFSEMTDIVERLPEDKFTVDQRTDLHNHLLGLSNEREWS